MPGMACSERFPTFYLVQQTRGKIIKFLHIILFMLQPKFKAKKGVRKKPRRSNSVIPREDDALRLKTEEIVPADVLIRFL